MRSLLFGSAVIVLALAGFGAAAGYATDNSGNTCMVAVSCNAEGARCARSCLANRVAQVNPESPPATPAQQSPPLTAELARKCNTLTAKAFPPREPGNPAAGSAKGSGAAEENYFKKCAANGGRTDSPADSH
jgi:hypothetical protein